MQEPIKRRLVRILAEPPKKRYRRMTQEPAYVGERVAVWGDPMRVRTVVKRKLPYLVLDDETQVFWGNVSRVDLWHAFMRLSSTRVPCSDADAGLTQKAVNLTFASEGMSDDEHMLLIRQTHATSERRGQTLVETLRGILHQLSTNDIVFPSHLDRRLREQIARIEAMSQDT